MKKTLGLDLGTNSIGWAVVEDGNRIIDSGVRIFPIGVQESQYNKSGSEVSKNASRRISRMMRRRTARYHQRRTKLLRLLAEMGIPVDQSPALSARAFYELRVKAIREQIQLSELASLLLLLNKRRGFKSNKKSDKPQNDKELGAVKSDISELAQEIEKGGFQTVGAYFYSLFEEAQQTSGKHRDEPIARIRKRFVGREMYEREFELIWETQKRFYPEVLTDARKKQIGPKCIFFQRPLKSAKHLVAKCRFEPQNKVCPRSHWMFQEFRLWQKLNDIRVDSREQQRRPLTQQEKERISAYLHQHESISISQLRKLLGLERTANFSDIEKDIKGNTTYVRLKNALGTRWTVLEDDEDQLKHYYWHTLHFFDNSEKLFLHARDKMGLSDEDARQYAHTSLEPDYGSISLKAIKKILPYLKAGMDYAQACIKAGYHHSKEEDIALRDQISPLRQHEIRNPIVQQATSEAIRLVNAIIQKHGPLDRVRIELPRELKKPKHKREEIRAKNIQKEKQRKLYAEFLTSQLGRMVHPTSLEVTKYELWLEMGCEKNDLEGFDGFTKKSNPKDRQKYELWLEANRISPYTGKVISLSKLFSPEIEIEHILPYSRTMDDSFMNKTLCEKAVNVAKGNDTPYEYFQKRPDHEWEAFCKRIKNFPPPKQDKFLCKEIPDGFLSNQLTNTAYIAQEVRRKIKEVCADTLISNGQATSVLRRLWGLNSVLNLDNDRVKNRNDHRHHAVDAIVIACTSTHLLQILADYSQFDALGKLRNDHIQEPWPHFREDVERQVRYMLTSYRKDKRLIVKRKNPLKGQPSSRAQVVAGVRGALHEETYYGKIRHPETGEEVYVTRWPLSKFSEVDQLNKIVDKAIRRLLHARVAAHGGNIKEAFRNLNEQPIWMPTKDPAKKIPITSVRVAVSGRMVQLRPRENPNLYAPTGNNFIIGIYEDPATQKRDFETLSLLEAVKRKQHDGNLLPATRGSKVLRMTLQQRDMVIVYKNHPDEIQWEDPAYVFSHLYMVRKFDAKGTIGLAKHELSDVKIDKAWNDQEGGPRSVSTFRALKVHVDILGKIYRKREP